MNDEYCHLNLPASYELYWLMAYSSLAIVGLFYAILGKHETPVIKKKLVLFTL